MHDVTPGQPCYEDRLTVLFRRYNRRLQAYVTARLGRYDWHLGEELTADAWLSVCKYLPTMRAADDAAFPWLCAVGRSAVSAHYRRARSRETPRDFSAPWAARVLPLAPSAEEVAVARYTADRILRAWLDAGTGAAA